MDIPSTGSINVSFANTQRASRDEPQPLPRLPDQFDPGRRPSTRRNRFATDRVPPSTQSTLGAVGYALHSPVWWLRRISGEPSRLRDTAAVAAWLRAKEFVKVDRTHAPSYRGLMRAGITHQFWWINGPQIKNIELMLKKMSSEAGPTTDQVLNNRTNAALFGRASLDLSI